MGCFILILAGCSSMQPSVQTAAAGSHAEHASGRFVYVGSVPIYGWKVRPNGTLTPIPGSPFSIKDEPQRGLAAARSGKFVFVNDSDAQQNTTIDTFKVNDDGSLALVSQSPSGFTLIDGPGRVGWCTTLSVDPFDQNVLAGCTLWDAPVGLVEFSIQQDESLHKVDGFEFVAETMFGNPIAYTPDGNFAFAPWGNKWGGPGIDVLQHATNVWTRLPQEWPTGLPAPSDSFGAGFGAPDVSADGRYLLVPYALRDDATELFHQFIAVLGISSAGGLTNLPQSPVAVPGATRRVLFDATGRFLFASTTTGVDVYTFDPTNGTLTLQPGVEAGQFPTLTVSHDLLFAASDHLYVFRIDASTGALTNTAVAAFGNDLQPQIAIIEH